MTPIIEAISVPTDNNWERGSLAPDNVTMPDNVIAFSYIGGEGAPLSVIASSSHSFK